MPNSIFVLLLSQVFQKKKNQTEGQLKFLFSNFFVAPQNFLWKLLLPS